MLNTNNTAAAQPIQFNNIFRNTGIDVTENTTGRIFDESNFAKDWDSIYIKPSSLSMGGVTIGMRKLTKPTLLVTTKRPEMALILASEDEPVFIRPFESPLENTGYLLAYSIMPHISPEFIYYMCKYDYWDKIINNINLDRVEYIDHDIVWGIVEGEVNWNRIGTTVLWCGYSRNPNELGSFESAFPFTASMIKDAIGDFILPSREKQNELIKAAKEQEAKFASFSEPKHSVAELLNKYKVQSGYKSIFSNSAYGLLVELYKRSQCSLVQEEVINALASYTFEQGFLNEEELNFLAKHLAEVFDLLVNPSQFSHGKDASFLQPIEVTKFLCEIANFPKDVTVYNPFAGAASYAVTLPNAVIGEEVEFVTWALGQIRLAANKVNPGTKILLGDSFESLADNKRYKAIITSPVFSTQKNQEIFDIVRDLYNKLDNGGSLVCLVTLGFLYSKKGNYSQVKEQLIAERAIKGIITLPANIFPGTNISQAAVVITKGEPNEQILFADATRFTRFSKSAFRATTFDYKQFLDNLEDDIQDFYDRGCIVDADSIGVTVSYENLNGVNLTPSIYLTPKPENGIALSEYATIIPELRGKDRNADYFVIGSSIPEAMHRKPYKLSKADEKVATVKCQVQLPDYAVIVALSHGKVRTVYTENFNGRIAFPCSSVMVLEPKPNVSAKFLAALISQRIVADQILALSTGSTQPRLDKVELNEIIVPRIDKSEERESLVAEVISSEMSDYVRDQATKEVQREREIRSTRHAMIQTLAALSSNWSLIKDYADNNDGKIDLTNSIGRINPMRINNLFDSITHSIKTLEQQVDSLKLEVQDWGQDTAIDPYAFIQQYIATHNTPLFKMENLGNDNIVDAPWYDDETGKSGTEHIVGFDVFYAPKRLLERIFNNIVANARSHGFTDSNRSDYKIHFDWSNENSNIVITIANNGAPLKDGVSAEDVFMRGFTTSLNKDNGNNSVHSGQGGFEIRVLMEGYGRAEILSYPDNEFSVVYKLTFEKTNSETINLFED